MPNRTSTSRTPTKSSPADIGFDQTMFGAKSQCRSCKAPIHHDGRTWIHTNTRPRHNALPLSPQAEAQEPQKFASPSHLDPELLRKLSILLNHHQDIADALDFARLENGVVDVVKIRHANNEIGHILKELLPG